MQSGGGAGSRQPGPEATPARYGLVRRGSVAWQRCPPTVLQLEHRRCRPIPPPHPMDTKSEEEYRLQFKGGVFLQFLFVDQIYIN